MTSNIQAAVELLQLLQEKRLTLATAEGSSGGALSQVLTAVPGSSAVFLAGVAAYGDGAKRKLLGVPAGVFRKYGAVSAEAAAAMADLVRQRSHSSLGVSVTAIEGPGGGSAEKPVGSAYIAVSDGRKIAVQKLLLAPGEAAPGGPSENARSAIRGRSVLAAIHLCSAFVKGEGWAKGLTQPADRYRFCIMGNPAVALLRYFLPWKGDRPSDVFCKLLLLASAAACVVAISHLTGITVTNAHTAQVLEQAVKAKETAPTPETQSNLPADYLPQFAALYGLNPDIIGWITIPDTNVNLPVVQGEDNDFYLRHDIHGEKDVSGLPFMDYRIQLQPHLFPANLLIYGHNMKSGMMFRDLTFYEDPAYYKAHPLITFDTVYDQGQWVIISCFEANTEEAYGPVFAYFNFWDSQDPQEIQWYIDEIAARSYFDVDIDVSTQDRFLTLQTCANDAYETKICVVARRLREGESASGFDFDSAAANPDRVPPRS